MTQTKKRFAAIVCFVMLAAAFFLYLDRGGSPVSISLKRYGHDIGGFPVAWLRITNNSSAPFAFVTNRNPDNRAAISECVQTVNGVQQVWRSPCLSPAHTRGQAPFTIAPGRSHSIKVYLPTNAYPAKVRLMVLRGRSGSIPPILALESMLLLIGVLTPFKYVTLPQELNATNAPVSLQASDI